MVTRASAPLPYMPQSFRYGHLRGEGHPQLLGWLQRWLVDESAPPEAAMSIYKRRPHLVCAVQGPADMERPWRRLVVKRFGWRGKQHYLFSPLKRSKACKSYRAACHLLSHGLLTPLPLGVGEARRWGFIQSNVYATEAITDYVTLREYCTALPDGIEGLHEVMQLVATYARRMHDSGLWHRDLFLANFLMTGPRGNRRLYLIDLNRARRLPYMPVWLRAIDLARLEWHAWQPQFIALYGAERFPTPYVLWVMRLYGRWRTWRHRVLRVVNPLRQRLGLK